MDDERSQTEKTQRNKVKESLKFILVWILTWLNKNQTSVKGTKEKKRKEGAEEIETDEGKSKRKKFQASWMDRVGEDPDKPLKESSAGMEIDESELRTYNDGNPKVLFLF